MQFKTNESFSTFLQQGERKIKEKRFVAHILCFPVTWFPFNNFWHTPKNCMKNNGVHDAHQSEWSCFHPSQQFNPRKTSQRLHHYLFRQFFFPLSPFASPTSASMLFPVKRFHNFSLSFNIRIEGWTNNLLQYPLLSQNFGDSLDTSIDLFSLPDDKFFFKFTWNAIPGSRREKKFHWFLFVRINSPAEHWRAANEHER